MMQSPAVCTPGIQEEVQDLCLPPQTSLRCQGELQPYSHSPPLPFTLKGL